MKGCRGGGGVRRRGRVRWEGGGGEEVGEGGGMRRKEGERVVRRREYRVKWEGRKGTSCFENP